MSKVVIRGTALDASIEIDGEKPKSIRSFKLLAPGPDQKMVLQLNIDVDELEFEGEAEVQQANA